MKILTPQPTSYSKLPDMKKVTAVVLAGGRGKRMGVLCEARPKPALPFGSKNSVIDFTLRNCMDSGIENIIALVDYQRSNMYGYLKEWSYANKLGDPIHVREPKRGSYRGTADAVYQNIDMLRQTDAEAVLILAADHVYRMDYRKMFDFHRRAGADVTIGVVPVPIERAYQFGIVATDSDDKIVAFQEKPEAPQSNLASMGIYIFNADVLDRYMIKDALEADSSHDFGYSVIPRVIENEKVFAYKFDGYWQDIGTPEAYHQAHMDLLNGSLAFNLKSAWSVDNEIDDILRSMQITGENIRNSIIGEDCVVNGIVENSVLSPGVFVAENTVVRNSVVMARAIIGHGSTVCGCILDEDVEIGEYARVGSTAQFPAGREQVTVIKSGVVIPGHTSMGNTHHGTGYLSPDTAEGLVLPGDFSDEDLSVIKQLKVKNTARMIWEN